LSEHVLHLDLISLAPDLTPEARGTVVAGARDLSALPDVLQIGALEASDELALYFVLKGFAALEPFGTDPAYVRFLQGSVAPVLRGLAGADVRLQDDFPSDNAPFGACVAVAAPFQTYDWEISAALTAWRDGLNATSSTIGLAVGEHGRYRGVALAFAAEPLPGAVMLSPRFGTTLITGRARRLA
jgi:hypothetical protein